MSKQEQIPAEIRPWVLISVLKDNITPADLEKITPQIEQLVDDWQSQGKLMWSGPFSDNQTGWPFSKQRLQKLINFMKDTKQFVGGF